MFHISQGGLPRGAAAMAIAAVLVSLSGAPVRAQGREMTMVRVINATHVVRWFPHTPDEVIATLSPGTTLEVLDQQRGWYWVITPRDENGSRRSGWVAEHDVERFAAETVAEAPGSAAAVSAVVPAATPQPATPVREPRVPRTSTAVPEHDLVPKSYQFDDVLFDLDRFAIKPQAVGALDRVTAAMQGDPRLQLTLQGNTCDLGTAAYNMALGERRAEAVRDYFVSHGVAPDRLRTVSFGEERPKYDNAHEETRRLNRRVTIVADTAPPSHAVASK